MEGQPSGVVSSSPNESQDARGHLPMVDAPTTCVDAADVDLDTEAVHTTNPLPELDNLVTSPSKKGASSDKAENHIKAKNGGTALRTDEVPGATLGLGMDKRSKVMPPDNVDNTDHNGVSKSGHPELSTSPSTSGQSISSALVAAIKVPSFSGAFKRSSSAAPEQAAVDLNERTPSEPGPIQSSLPPTSSYFPSSASFTSFFSGGSKPRASPQSASSPPTTTSAVSAPFFVEPLGENQTGSLSSVGTSAPPAGSQPNASVEPSPDWLRIAPDKESVSATSGSAPPSSLTMLMKAAAPYFATGSRQLSDAEAAAEKRSVGGVESGEPTDAVTGSVDAKAGFSGGPSGASERSSNVTTPSAGQATSPAEPAAIASAGSGQAMASREGSPPSQISDLQITVVTSSQDHGFHSVTSSPELPVSTPPEGNLMAHLDLEQAPGTLSRDTALLPEPQATPPSGTAPGFPTVSSAITPPGTSPQTASSISESQEPNPSTCSQGGSSAQATSPSTSYLSLPSFLPTWSTITAQLPSMPSAPFISREQEPASEAASKPAANKEPLPTPPSDFLTGGKTPDQMAGASAEAVDTPPPEPDSSQQFDRIPQSGTSRTDPAMNVTPPGDRTTTGRGDPQSGGKEQAAAKRDPDPPDAAAADAIAGGLAGVFGPVTMEADKQVEAALRSQEKLAMSIDRLTRGLDKLLEESPQPLVAQQAARLAHMRKRVQALAAALKVIQGRIDSMNWALDRKSSRVPIARGRSATAPNSPHSYQAVTESVPRNRHSVPTGQSGGSGSPSQESGKVGGLQNTGEGGPGSESSASSSRGAEATDVAELATARVSSRSPEKGHRRAISHDVRFSAAFTNKR